MPRCRKVVPASIRAAAIADYGAGVPNKEIGRRYGIHFTMARVWYRAAQGQQAAARSAGNRASSLSGLCTVPGCGLPLEGHARCRECTILLGPGHWNQAGGAYCEYCGARRRR